VEWVLVNDVVIDVLSNQVLFPGRDERKVLGARSIGL